MNRLVLAAMLFVLCSVVSAQVPKNKTTASINKAAQPTTKTAQPIDRAVQPMDKEYSDSIIKNTTEKFFLTELIDHLPASDKVPSPAKVLGYPIGEPNKLTYTKDQYRYYHELAKATPRVMTFTAPEKSEQGREQIEKGFAVVDQALAGKQYLGGDRLSAADAALFYVEFWAAKRVGMSLPANCAAHFDRMMARPAVQRALQQEGMN